MNQNTADDETILRGVLGGWKAAVDKYQPDQVAAHFASAVSRALSWSFSPLMA
ncbi:hypothetical protein [Actinopolymorpha pittospori]